MNIRQFQKENRARCEAVFHPVASWSPTDWACALAGEAGEACNEAKKLKRGDGSVDALAKELADTLCYLCLLAERLGIDLNDAALAKFDEVSAKKGYGRRLLPEVQP
jgi:NTP pyrophosphatase (non-canonical NTP hydrolase)